ncbi:MAG: ATP-binding protein, partial [Elusimicrobiota bacterium]
FEECLTIRRRFRDARGEAIVLVNQADLALLRGEAAEAAGLATRGLDLFRPYTAEFLRDALDEHLWGKGHETWAFYPHVYGWDEYYVLEEGGRVVACAPIVLFALDQDGVFTLSEGRGLDGLGLKPGEVVGRSVFEVYKDNPAILANIRRALAGESFGDLNEAAGRVFDTRYTPLTEGGMLVGAIGVATDVTDLNLAVGDLKRHRRAMDSAMDGMAILGPDEKYSYMNEAHAGIYGYGAPSELLGRSWKTLYEPREALRFEREILPAMRREGRWRGEAEGRRKDGSLFAQEVSLSPLDDGGLICVVRDVTERKKAESERSLLLGREQSARLEAEKSNHSRDEFLAVLSHEMRTPITAMLGWTWLLRSESLDEEARSKALDIIQYNMKLQAQIIEDLLDVSRLITGRLRLDSRLSDPRLPIRAALENIRAAAAAKSIRVEEDLDASAGPVRGDPNRLQQVFWNLLSNAVKFTPEGGSVRVSLRREGDRLSVRVSDTGPGIGPEFLPYVFDRFRQEEDSLTRKFRGLGLGLSLVKQLTEMHGGSVSVESPAAGGTTFTVDLPAGAQGAAGEASS